MQGLQQRSRLIKIDCDLECICPASYPLSSARRRGSVPPSPGIYSATYVIYSGSQLPTTQMGPMLLTKVGRETAAVIYNGTQ